MSSSGTPNRKRRKKIVGAYAPLVLAAPIGLLANFMVSFIYLADFFFEKVGFHPHGNKLVKRPLFMGDGRFSAVQARLRPLKIKNTRHPHRLPSHK